MSDKEKADGLKAVAKHLGMTKRQARHRADFGQLPTFKIARTIVASRSALDAWLADLARSLAA